MLIVSDLDGTLLGRSTPLSQRNKESFLEAKSKGAICAIATGRSLYGVLTELSPDFPLDYLIFSSGAGIYDWKNKQLLHSTPLGALEIHKIYKHLEEKNLDFTIQLEAPDSHRFFHSKQNPTNSDFMLRLDYHGEHGKPVDSNYLPNLASEFIVIHSHPASNECYHNLKNQFSADFNVVRATSPFDGKSLWVEIFHPKVSKAHAADWIRERHQIPLSETCALGNDYNDLQLLSWAGHPLVVADSAPELIEKYPQVTKHTENAFYHACKEWWKRLKR